RRLGVFAGGATLEMAEQVAGATGLPDLDVLEGLDTLARQSLVQQVEQDAEPRFGMLETVREFALEQLAQAGEAEATRAAHAEALLRRLDGDLGPEQWAPDGGPWSLLTERQLERERENLALALRWCDDHEDGERGLRLLTRSIRLWRQVGPRAEGLA